MIKKTIKRVLIKLSGEALSGETESIDHHKAQLIAKEISALASKGIQIGIVIGGGNIFRGSLADSFGFARTPADHIGMLATSINGLILGQTLASQGCRTRVMSALNFDGIVEMYNWNQALLSLQKGIVMIFVGGTGNPYFTTDTAAAMRASEIEADMLIKATKVDGVFDKDPMQYPDAVKYDHVTFSKALSDDLHIMDGAAIALCRTNQIPIYVVNLFAKGSIVDAVCHSKGGTIVDETA